MTYRKGRPGAGAVLGETDLSKIVLAHGTAGGNTQLLAASTPYAGRSLSSGLARAWPYTLLCEKLAASWHPPS